MNTEALVDLSTRLAHDLKDWSEEVARRDTISPDQLRVLREAADIIEQATLSATPTIPEQDAAPPDNLSS